MTVDDEEEPRANGWMDQAACEGVDGDVFFPDGYGDDKTRLAKEICATCPVIRECRVWAITHHETEGIWGGLTPGQRKARKPVKREVG